MTNPPSGEMVIEMLARATAGDWTRAGDILGDIAEQGGLSALFATACGIAESIKRVGGLGSDDFNYLEVAGPDDVGVIRPEDAPDGMQPNIWAARFLVAHLNGDSETAIALFATEAHDIPRLIERMCSLIHMAAQVIRQRVP